MMGLILTKCLLAARARVWSQLDDGAKAFRRCFEAMTAPCEWEAEETALVKTSLGQNNSNNGGHHTGTHLYHSEQPRELGAFLCVAHNHTSCMSRIVLSGIVKPIFTSSYQFMVWVKKIVVFYSTPSTEGVESTRGNSVRLSVCLFVRHHFSPSPCKLYIFCKYITLATITALSGSSTTK